MRKHLGILASLGAVWLVASCGTGAPPPAAGVGPRAGGPADAARRYQVLTAETACPATPEPTPTGTGGCTAVAGQSFTLSVSGVLQDGPDFVNVLYDDGQRKWFGDQGTVSFDVIGGAAIATVTAALAPRLELGEDPDDLPPGAAAAVTLFLETVAWSLNLGGTQAGTGSFDAPIDYGPGRCDPFFQIGFD